MVTKSDSRRTATTNKTSLPRRLLDSLPQKVIAIATIAVAISPLSVLAEQMEKVALFDFKADPSDDHSGVCTIDGGARQATSCHWKFMDERCSMIRAKLRDMKDTLKEVKQLKEWLQLWLGQWEPLWALSGWILPSRGLT